MIRPIFALMVVVATTGMAAAQTPMQKCRAIADSLERLRCYDAIKEEPAGTAAQPAQPAQPSAQPAAQPAQPAVAGEEPLITKAKAMIKSELRDPDSAQFKDVKVRTVKGKQAVCGYVDAKNSNGIMTGPQPFAYDGAQGYLAVYNPGPANITNLSAETLRSRISNRLKNYYRLCG